MAETKTNAKNNFVANNPIFSWKSPEFISYKKDKKWIIGIVLVAIVLIILLVTQKQWIGAVMVAIAAVFYIFLSNTKPKEIGCAVYNEGVVVDKRVFNYNQFKSFWLVNGPLPKIHFQFLGRFAGQVPMPLDEQDPEQIRMFIAKYLPEEDEKQEDISDIMNRLFRP